MHAHILFSSYLIAQVRTEIKLNTHTIPRKEIACPRHIRKNSQMQDILFWKRSSLFTLYTLDHMKWQRIHWTKQYQLILLVQHVKTNILVFWYAFSMYMNKRYVWQRRDLGSNTMFPSFLECDTVASQTLLARRLMRIHNLQTTLN